MELELFHELGIEFISTGKFLDPKHPRMDSLAAPLDINVNGEWFYRVNKLNPKQQIWKTPILTQDFVDKFDAVYVAHCGPNTRYLASVWEFIKKKPVIYRTYGLQSPDQELFCQKAKRDNKRFYLIRFSEKEKAIKNYAGIDAAIFPYVDENLYNNWNGSDKSVLTFQNWFTDRYKMDHYDIYDSVISNFKHYTHGIHAPNGVVKPEKQKELYRNSRIYFSLGSRPSPITINVFEAMITGMPVITWGYKYGATPGLNMYQIPEIIDNYDSGLCTDDPVEMKYFINRCLTDDNFAKKISCNARTKAINTFGKQVIKEKWFNFFKEKGLL